MKTIIKLKETDVVSIDGNTLTIEEDLNTKDSGEIYLDNKVINKTVEELTKCTQ